MSTKIEWTDETWNPIVGCSKISEGSENCYAEKMAYRLASMEKLRFLEDLKYRNVISPSGRWMGNTHFDVSQLQKPLKWKKPRKIFVCSMGDLFHESVPFCWIDEVFDVIAKNQQHTFQILTKRPKQALKYFKYLGQRLKNEGLDSIPTQSTYMLDYVAALPNLWLGVTTENQQRANERIPVLLQIPAVVHFISVEPMLSAIDLNEVANNRFKYFIGDDDKYYFLDWVICGGENGHKARPLHPEWVFNLQKQCEKIKVAFYFKGWGEWGTTWFDFSKGLVFKYYTSYLQFTQKLWVKKGDACIDMDGMICTCGGDMQKAKYPVAIMTKVGKKSSGSLINQIEYKQLPKPYIP